MKEKFMRFMQGRYGVLDTLGKVLLVLGLVLAFFAPVFSGDHVIGMVFYLLGWGCLIYAYFRMFSRNVRKRYDENVRFLNKTAKIRGFFKSQKNLMAQRKDYHIYTCPVIYPALSDARNQTASATSSGFPKLPSGI